MLIESRSRTTEGAETEAELAARRSLFAGVRTRVLVFFLILLVISTAASVLVLREVLISRIGDQVEKQPQPVALQGGSQVRAGPLHFDDGRRRSHRRERLVQRVERALQPARSP